jgi:hypothetical protein
VPSAAPPPALDDLAAPCFEAVRDLAARLPSLAGARACWPPAGEIDAALAPLAGVRFVAGEKRRAARRPGRRIDAAELYEVRVAARREVPTRAESAHDLFNALAWAAFPAAKWALTARLAEAQRARLRAEPGAWRLPERRTRAHDRLALLDEGGILVAAGSDERAADEAGLAAAIAAGRARALVFGHALLEHALRGTGAWGAALAFPVDPAGPVEALRARLDQALAAALAAGDRIEQPAPWARLSLAALGG